MSYDMYLDELEEKLSELGIDINELNIVKEEDPDDKMSKTTKEDKEKEGLNE